MSIMSNRITVLDLGKFDQAENLIQTLNNEQRLDVDIAQANAGLMMAQNKLVEATQIYQYICGKKPQEALYWLNWAAALRGLRWTVTPYKILQRGLCYSPGNKDVQEALLQILAEMAKSDSTKRCMELWPKKDNSMKDIYLFNRQFLGIGTSEYQSNYLAKTAREWEERYQTKIEGNLWKDTIQEKIEKRKLRIGYLRRLCQSSSRKIYASSTK